MHLKRRILSQNGHLSNEDAGKVLSELLTGKGDGIIGHLSQENNTPSLAHKTVKECIESYGIDTLRDIVLELTYRHRPTKIYTL